MDILVSMSAISVIVPVNTFPAFFKFL